VLGLRSGFCDPGASVQKTGPSHQFPQRIYPATVFNEAKCDPRALPGLAACDSAEVEAFRVSPLSLSPDGTVKTLLSGTRKAGTAWHESPDLPQLSICIETHPPAP